MWDVPDVDFRPFKEDVNIAEQKAAEVKALESVKVTHYEVTNLETGEFKRLPFDQYMSEFKNYPKIKSRSNILYEKDHSLQTSKIFINTTNYYFNRS